MWFLTPLFILISLKVIKRKQRCFSKEIDFYKNLMAKGSELIISDSSNGEGGGPPDIEKVSFELSTIWWRINGDDAHGRKGGCPEGEKGQCGMTAGDESWQTGQPGVPQPGPLGKCTPALSWLVPLQTSVFVPSDSKLTGMENASLRKINCTYLDQRQILKL